MLKRGIEILLSLIGLIICLPIFLVISVLISLKMPGPVLFKQFRVGMNAKLFTMVKFRTMKVDSSASLVSVLGEERITPFGAVLRKYKLDELPGLWNIFKGDMSFVGPRPDVLGYADKLVGLDRQILRIKPGLTGPASLKYANEEKILTQVQNPQKYNDEIIYPNKVRINLNYVKNQTLWLDIKIIILTVLRRKMADQKFN
jgi:lipopolysaccharide/colanic/teichoic acid biosynthesis glycosyltransferase